MAARVMDAVGAGLRFLEAGWADGYPTALSPTETFETTTPSPPEVFSAMVCADVVGRYLSPGWIATVRDHLVGRLQPDGTVTFFVEGDLPPDTDCAAMLWVALHETGGAPPTVARQISTGIARLVAADRVVPVYVPTGGRRDGLVDAVVAANTLAPLVHAGHDAVLAATEAHVLDALVSGRFLEGTRYYPSPDTFLVSVARLVRLFPQRYGPWRAPLARGLADRAGRGASALELAQWVLAAEGAGVLGSEHEGLEDPLLEAMEPDGSWPARPLFRYGRRQIFFGSRYVSTAYACAALAALGRRP